MFDRKVAGIKLCELRGVDPYERNRYTPITYGDSLIHAVCHYKLAWSIAADEIDEFMMIGVAIKAGEQ